MRSLLWVILLAIGTTSAVGQRAADLAWTTYKNSRFGMQMRYPAEVFTEHRASRAGDGDLFTTVDGRAKLLIGAFENTQRHSPASYQRFIARESYPGLRADYSPVGAGWSVLSGTRGETMIYEKVIFSCSGRVINSFALVYPIDERQLYDPIVEGIEDSFRPGIAGCEHAASF